MTLQQLVSDFVKQAALLLSGVPDGRGGLPDPQANGTPFTANPAQPVKIDYLTLEPDPSDSTYLNGGYPVHPRLLISLEDARFIARDVGGAAPVLSTTPHTVGPSGRRIYYTDVPGFGLQSCGELYLAKFRKYIIGPDGRVAAPGKWTPGKLNWWTLDDPSLDPWQGGDIYVG